MDPKNPRVTIVIPSLDGHRDGKLPALLKSLGRQSFKDFEVRLVLRDPRQGRAINQAVRDGRGDIIMTLDDDTQLGHPWIIETLVRVLDSDPAIGIAGASTVPTPDASEFQRTACRQIPRRYFPVVERIVDSDMAQHPCLAMRREVFEEVGGEDESLVRGLDPLLRHKVRQAGYRVVIAPFTWVGHPLPESIFRISRMYFRNGRGSAFGHRHFPERIYELSHGGPEKFAPRRSFFYRSCRYPLRMLSSIFTFQWFKLVSEVSHLAGYLWEFLLGSRKLPDPPPPGRMVTYSSTELLPTGANPPQQQVLVQTK